MNSKKTEPFRVVINTSTDPNVPLIELVRGNRKAKLPPIAIKNVRLDTDRYLLVVNDGERVVAFKSKRHKKGLDKETKLFKVLVLLFDFRLEKKGEKILHSKNLNPDYTSLKNIAGNSGSPTQEAAYRNIKRLNGYFEENGLSIWIEKHGNDCRLVVKKS
ncbi:MAG: hypothetical protein HYT61_03655 [Candidatus Yanofskybacteria bacterium]|nr:hypothetical protein [Candidatus Yanofskybacteria bacterium]